MLLDLVAKQWQAAIGLGNIHDGFNVIGWNVPNRKALTTERASCQIIISLFKFKFKRIVPRF